MEDLNEQLMQDSLERQKEKQEMYWEVSMNPVSQSVMYQEYQSANEVPSEKPTLLQIMERFQGKNLFPEATERTRTYLERMGFNNMPHPNPISHTVVTEEEREREALMMLLKSQIDDIKEKGV